ncbi:preprotein translocase subunit YajC [Schumannella soli]|uniref:Preprotein translocase subunit YajC n=1 Tax=Schumannella soli TaxID=2590779 RepID=A0A506Y4K9_9MICO|nr:preprotein translocase subunit YajC [Schumannella soli]TPW76347.1 preprotein translocase subunit YajC [Schumannella soli]
MDQTLLYVALGAVLVVFIFLSWRNSKKRQKEQTELKEKMVPGVEIMTSTGIYGTLISVDDDKNEAVIETAPGQTLRIHKQTLLKVVEPEATEPEVEEKAGPSLNESSVQPISEKAEFGERTASDKKDSE